MTIAKDNSIVDHGHEVFCNPLPSVVLQSSPSLRATSYELIFELLKKEEVKTYVYIFKYLQYLIKL
jgi:hypothetical protein